jgi:hypothetical protein
MRGFLLSSPFTLPSSARGRDQSPSPRPSPLKGEGACKERAFIGRGEVLGSNG